MPRTVGKPQGGEKIGDMVGIIGQKVWVLKGLNISTVILLETFIFLMNSLVICIELSMINFLPL